MALVLSLTVCLLRENSRLSSTVVRRQSSTRCARCGRRPFPPPDTDNEERNHRSHPFTAATGPSVDAGYAAITPV